MDDLLREFLVETGESLDHVDVQLVRFEHEPDNKDILRTLFRLVHTIKGTCGFLGLPRLEALAHAAETLMGRFRDGAPVTRDAVSLILASVDRIKQILAALEKTTAEPEGSDGDLISALERMAGASDDDDEIAFRSDEVAAPDIALTQQEAERDAACDSDPSATSGVEEPTAASSTLRVNVDTLEQLLTMVSELVLTRNQLLDVARQQSGHAFNAPLQRLSQVTTQLQDCVMKTRMQPIGNAWHKLPRLVRDLSLELDKDIDLEMSGADTELDRQVLDLIKDPLTHLVRNAADHGIESRQDRLAVGKLARGVIALRAYHAGGSITIEVSDDGRGLNHQRIAAKAIERGLISESDREKMTEAQIAKFIFHPGFSTAQKITAISGRGVGLDVVNANVEQIGGSIDVQSQSGHGVTFILTLPLTLAIVPALLIGAGGQQFAAPQNAVAELVHIDSESQTRIEKLDGGRVLIVRGEMLPLIALSTTLGLGGDPDAQAEGYVAIMSVGAARFGILVDQVFHTEEIVVKPMSTMLRHMSIYSGNTILGDGSVVLILDPIGLARKAAVVTESSARARAGKQHLSDERARHGGKTALLIFRSNGRRCALPLSAIARLEEVEAKSVERAGGHSVMQYHGKLLPLVGADALVERKAPKAPCLVLTQKDKSVGLVVEAIVDVIEQEIVLDGGDGPGVLGAAILNGEAMDVVDALHHLRATHPDIDRVGARATPRALMIEESPFFRDMIAPVLRAAGYEVTAVESLDQALAGAPSMYDVIIAEPAVIAPSDEAARSRLARLAAASAQRIAWCNDFDSLRESRLADLGVSGAVSKFDRQKLVSMLESLQNSTREAA
ncbi:chemotaxis protein CheW [Terrarubrum flagellatum]|uniref:chemotaxis protein CheW n=1 Tax=Terrirubrum flagellatum TaxID=2895980 RepID=UPI003144EC42